MRNRVDISDIRKRKSILGESSEMSNTITISNAYEQAKKTDRYEDIRHFFQEAGKSRYNANEYSRACIDFLEHSTNPELLGLFKSNILPRVNDFEIGYMMESNLNENMKEIIHEQIIKNKISDRIMANHANISKQYDIDSIFDKSLNESNIDLAICKLCSVIDKFDLPVYGKVNIALEESSYMIQLHTDLNYNPLRAVVEFFSISNDLTSDDKKKIDDVIKENYVVEDNREEKQYSSFILELIDKYVNREEHNIYEIKVLYDQLFKADAVDWIKNINNFFNLITKIVCYSNTVKDTEDISISDIFGLQFADDILHNYGSYPEFKAVCKATAEAVKNSYEICNQILKQEKDPEIVDRIDKYLAALDSTGDAVTYFEEISYTKENVQYMKSANTVLTEAASMVTLYEFKNHNFDPLIVKFGKFDKMLQREIRDWANKKLKKAKDTVKDFMDKVEDKMYKESSIYDMIVEDHIDYVVASYLINPEFDLDFIHKRCTSLVKSFNESELANTTYTAYYTLSENQIDFHISDSTEILLDDVESMIVRQSITDDELDNLAESLFVADCLDEDFNLFESATEFFINNPTEGYFETFCDLCSMSGVQKETVQEIYNYIKLSTDMSFVTENAYYMNSYKEQESDVVIASEAMMILQAMLEDTKPIKKTNTKSLTTNNNGKSKVKLTPNSKTSKVSSTVNKSKTSPTSKLSDVKDKVSGETKNPFKGININNLKLYAAGLKKNAKDAGNKYQSMVRDLDFTVERLIKAIKGALISDRRESIIKGSVIPSFHKCILIAVGLAGLAWFNAPLAIITAIGGFAASKKLTEKERALMLDDISIELELLDKEIQMADSRNQIKKMRQLMKMKKTLQREYQRIKYNIRVGKDFIPSTSYLPEKD